MGDAQADQVFELRDGAFESPFRRESPNVEFVDDSGRERRSLPAGIAPAELRMVDEPRRTMDAEGLPGRSRIREGISAVQKKPIVGPRLRVRIAHGPPPAGERGHLQ